MAAVAGVEAGTQTPAPAVRTAARRRSFPVWRWAILLIAGVYFLIPLYAALRFAGLKAFGDIFKQSGFYPAIGLSLRLAVITTILTLVLMVPTIVYVHLRLPQIRRSMEGITILPIVIPPIVLIIGVLKVAPGFLLSTPYLLALFVTWLMLMLIVIVGDRGTRKRGGAQVALFTVAAPQESSQTTGEPE
jgi:putative spermidine/putrescine transport system permease protein